jgi:hypothetical protein
MIEFKRATRNRSGNRVWASRCGNFMVAESAVCFGVALDPVYYTAWERYRARDRDGFAFIWRRISRHRKRATAQKACEKQARIREAA